MSPPACPLEEMPLLLRITTLALLGFVGTVSVVSCSGPEKDVPPSFPQKVIKKSKPTTRDDVLAVGDTLEVFVMEDPSFNGTYKVREKGDIILPKLGRVDVQGLNIDQVQKKLQQSLEESQLHKATVIADRINHSPAATPFEETPKLLVFVTGKVNRPGQHLIAMTNGDTVYAYEAVLIAGGVSQFADEKHAYILRRGVSGAREKIPLDLRAIRQGSATDRQLVEGDMICVPERRFAL